VEEVLHGLERTQITGELGHEGASRALRSCDDEHAQIGAAHIGASQDPRVSDQPLVGARGPS
jgi:hypothetical protein